MSSNYDEEEEFSQDESFKTVFNIIDGCEKIIIGKSGKSFPEFIDDLKQNLKTSTCQCSWITPTLSIHCLNCQQMPTSCICIPCFLAGNHQGHDVTIMHSSNGTCDCGDNVNWKPSGFCKNHPGTEAHPELTQLHETTRENLISTTSIVFQAALDYVEYDNSFAEAIQWIQNIVSLGDAPRRCVAIAISQSFDFFEIYQNSIFLSKENAITLINLFGSLTNDEAFRFYFSRSFISSMPKFVEFNGKISENNLETKNKPLYPIRKLYDITFHAMTDPIVQKLITDGLNWVSVAIEAFKVTIDMIFAHLENNFHQRAKLTNSLMKILELLKSAIKLNDKNVIVFVENFAEVLAEHELSQPLIREFDQKVDDPNRTQSVMFDTYFNLFHLCRAFRFSCSLH